MDRIHALTSEREELRVDTERERAEKSSLQAALTEEYRYTILYKYVYVCKYMHINISMYIARREGLTSRLSPLISHLSCRMSHVSCLMSLQAAHTEACL